MRESEYDETLKVIEHERVSKILNLKTKYALENNVYKVGEIIRDHIGFGKIVKIKPFMGYLSKYPECQYKCQELRQSDKKPFKNGAWRWICQSNIENPK